MQAESGAMSRAYDDPTGSGVVCLDVRSGEGFAVVRTAILEGVQFACKFYDGDIVAIHLCVESTAAVKRRGRTDIDPRAIRGCVHIIPVCSRAASDIID